MAMTSIAQRLGGGLNLQTFAAFELRDFRLLWANNFSYALVQGIERFAFVWLVIETLQARGLLPGAGQLRAGHPRLLPGAAGGRSLGSLGPAAAAVHQPGDRAGRRPADGDPDLDGPDDVAGGAGDGAVRGHGSGGGATRASGAHPRSGTAEPADERYHLERRGADHLADARAGARWSDDRDLGHRGKFRAAGDPDGRWRHLHHPSAHSRAGALPGPWRWTAVPPSAGSSAR